MSRKTALCALAVVAVVAGLLWYGKGGQARMVTPKEMLTESKLVASETEYDFGRISMADGKVSRSFTITNPAPGSVLLDSVVTSCMCTKASLKRGGEVIGTFGMPGHGSVPKANDTIGPGETRELVVTFDPAAHGPAGVGPIGRSVYLRDGDGGTVRIRISAVVLP